MGISEISYGYGAITENRPYGIGDGGVFYHDDPVNVIWHHNEGIGFDIRKSVSQFVPPPINHAPDIIQPHVSVFDFTKQVFSVPCAHRYKIRTVFGIIMPLQSDGAAMSFVFGFMQRIHKKIP